ncbi:lysosomal-associated transmembrane protein 4B-like [Copidosoma floridanum]|uniref:lysosomal-associated transmembrane protein 4B-like n=1 Tax=Copidosoma floridanum TaxID=29053 RepID=UPI0006C97E87|nr:lysosomal-associated transmembrane protein 4B-like [Copidosoma floridanum]
MSDAKTPLSAQSERYMELACAVFRNDRGRRFVTDLTYRYNAHRGSHTREIERREAAINFFPTRALRGSRVVTSFRLTACCACFPLRVGTIFSGVWCIVLSVVTIILLFTAENLEFHTIIMKVDTTTTKIILALNLVMTIIVSTLMIIGALTKRTTLMLPWIVLGILIVIGLLVSVLFTSITLFLKDDEVNRYLYGSFFLVFGLISVVIYAYFWFVVYSYYQQLRIEKSSFRVGPYGRPYCYQRR